MLISFAALCFLVLTEVRAGLIEKKFSLNRRTDGPYPLDIVDKLQDASLSKFEAWVAKHPAKSGCTLQNAARRMEFHDMSEAQRIEYTNAILCLQSKPPKSPRDLYPGALSRFDDFVATHETMAFELHSYWNWARTAEDPINSPLFNGNASSMGGNGAPSTYPGIPAMAGFKAPYDMIPSAGGGGCVTEGHIYSMTVSLGPFGKIVSNIPDNPRADGFGSNPRCLRRDVNKYAAAVTTANYTYALITEAQTADQLEAIMLGTPAKNDWGVHMGGHYTIGGDPGGDFFSSPGDPIFHLHHGMIDRIWWIWQMQDPDARMGVLPGNATLNDTIDLKWTAPKAKTWDLLSNMGGNDGDFCYVYV